MMSEQIMPAFIAKLVQNGVTPEVIELTVSDVRRIGLGVSITGNDPMVRAFAMEQAALLKRAGD